MGPVAIIITCILAFLLLAVLVMCWFFASIIVKPRVADYDKRFQEEVVKSIGLDEYESYKKEVFELASQFGYTLRGEIIPAPDGTTFADGRHRVAVIVHGYTGTRWGSIKYAKMLRGMGFDCVIYDQRNHGRSDRAPTTMGYYESKDLKTVCDFARRRFGENCVLGTHGESMGAATVMMHAPLDPKLAFVIEDCGYSDLTEEMAAGAKFLFHTPRFPFLPITGVFYKMRSGVSFKAVSPKKEIAKCPDLPMLFIHGEADRFVPFEMLRENYDAKPGKRRMRSFPGATHAMSFYSDPEGYTAEVSAFLRENAII